MPSNDQGAALRRRRSVVVLAALTQEMSALAARVSAPKRAAVGDWPVYRGHIGRTEVILAEAGLGKVNTASLTGALCERYRPGLLIFTGVAGGLDPSLGVGDVVIADRTIQHDTGVLGPQGLERYQAGHVPFLNPTDDLGYRPSTTLLETMRQLIPSLDLGPVLGRQPRVSFGTVLTGDQFLNDETTRSDLFAALAAQAIDMEGAALAQSAGHFGADHLVIRSLSDLAGKTAVIDFERFLPEAGANSARLVSGLIDRMESGSSRG